jgi:hypothetical protein
MARIAEPPATTPTPRRDLLDLDPQEPAPTSARRAPPGTPRRVLIFTEYADTKRYLEQQLLRRPRTSDRRADDASPPSTAAWATSARGHQARVQRRPRTSTRCASSSPPTPRARASTSRTTAPTCSTSTSRGTRPHGAAQRPHRPQAPARPEVRCHYFVLPQRAEDRVLDVLVRRPRTIHERARQPLPGHRAPHRGAPARGIEHERVEARHHRPTPTGGSRVKKTLNLEIGRELEQVRQAPARSSSSSSPSCASLLAEVPPGSASTTSPLPRRPLRLPRAARRRRPHRRERAEAATDPDRARWRSPPSTSARAPTRPGPPPSTPCAPPASRASPLRSGAARPRSARRVQATPAASTARSCTSTSSTASSSACSAASSRRASCTTSCPRLRAAHRRPRAQAPGPRPPLAVRRRRRPPARRGARRRRRVARGALRPLGEGDKADVLQLVEEALAQPRLREVEPTLQEHLRAHAARDVAELTPHLERRGKVLVERAVRDLTKRGDTEARDMAGILEGPARAHRGPPAGGRGEPARGASGSTPTRSASSPPTSATGSTACSRSRASSRRSPTGCARATS